MWVPFSTINYCLPSWYIKYIKIDNKTLYDPKTLREGRRYWGAGVAIPPPPLPRTFLHSKKKKRNQREKRKTFKAENIERLSPKSKCYCFSHSRASRVQSFFWLANHGGRQYLSMFHGSSTLKSISPALLGNH